MWKESFRQTWRYVSTSLHDHPPRKILYEDVGKSSQNKQLQRWTIVQWEASKSSQWYKGINGRRTRTYKETCEVLLYYPKIGGGDIIEDYSKKTVRNLLPANIDVHSRRLIDEFPKYGIKCIEKFQSHCANMTFYEKSRYDRTFQQVTHKGG